MINVCNISENFNKYKNVIISLLVDYYGQEYYDLINERINSTFIDFSSTPVEDYKYAKEHDSEISFSDKTIIKLRYKLYRRLEEKSRKNNFELLSDYILYNLLIIDNSETESDKELFWSLFSDENFNSGLIDSFSLKSTELLNDDSVAPCIKESIINDREKFKEISQKLGINISNITTDLVEKLIEYRKKLQKKHRKYIATNSQYGKKMLKAIKREFGLELLPEVLSNITFIENAYAGSIISGSDNNPSFHNFIRIPLIRLANMGVKGLDVNIIHELIHKIETDKNRVGIEILDDDNTNNIINEIRTQKLAIYITRKLHEQGIFIYDNPDDYKIEGESTYEWMFPLSASFLDKFENIFSSCAINNDIDKLNDYFGPSWITYSKHINDVYNSNMYIYSKYGIVPNIQLDDLVTSMINDMESVSKKGGMKNV